jgi:hypothetical protein
VLLGKWIFANSGKSPRAVISFLRKKKIMKNVCSAPGVTEERCMHLLRADCKGFASFTEFGEKNRRILLVMQ